MPVRRGTFGEPFSLEIALASNLFGADAYGHTLHLLGGMYDGNYLCNWTGGADVPILAEPYSNYNAMINGSIYCSGKNIIIKNMVISDTDFLSRTSISTGSSPADIPVQDGARIYGASENIIYVNCVIHDCRQGIFIEGTTKNIEFNGCVIYYNGWNAPDRGHGHGAYIQNQIGGVKLKDCIIHSNFGYGVHGYGEGTNYIDNITIDGCTSFCNGAPVGRSYNNILVGGYGIVANNPTLLNNMTYGGGGVNVGYNGGAIGAVLESNYFPDGITKVNAQIDTETNNYYGSTIGNAVFVRPNDYDMRRANVTIYNESEDDTIAVDLSAVSGLSADDSVTVRNVLDYFNDIQTLTLDVNKKITVSMIDRTVTAPQGWTAPETTFPQFGCFVVEKL